MSRNLYSQLSQRRWHFVLAFLVTICAFATHTGASSVDYFFNKRDRLHNRHTSLWNSLSKRQEAGSTHCSANQPCSNGACCGKTGWCGYGPEFCGDGCLANCDAKAECGEYAEVSNGTCPLNICCSRFGFCGTTEDFCGTGCQNGCSQPGPGAKSSGDVRDVVIGYYEGWTIDSAGCGGSVVDEIPVEGLTHLYFSFGFIEPDTYDIVPMPGNSSTAFTAVVNTKKRNPNLKVYIALGGWSFNDNDTIWQPVFGDLVSTQAKRSMFIDGLLDFLSEWGFDGVDFDWEYPGAPDRGGQKDDGVNFTLLLKELKEAIDSGLVSYGVTFTAPVGYWYLRHFDLEAMMQYVDWMNMMSYDLHGIWDKTSGVGPKVMAHTNLTEINLALNLMWRNNVPPSKIVMGLAFYGRTFTLGDPSCTSTGCPFVAGGAAGPCTNTIGFLSYKEISQIASLGGVTSTYEEAAAVRYFSYDSINWVSYDDQKTLKQKVDFASNLGLRGMMIWAIDLDNGSNTALQSVLYPRTLDRACHSNSTNSTNSTNPPNPPNPPKFTNSTNLSGTPVSSPGGATSATCTTLTVEAPGPTQTDTTGWCNKYHFAESGDYCYKIWEMYGITSAQFQAWNPATGSDTTGADCSVWSGYAYCVSISYTAAMPKASATSASRGNGTSAVTPTAGAAPGPTQTGTMSNCGKWYLVGSGDYCSAVWQKFEITGAQFHEWNTATGTDVNGTDCIIWLGYAYCVGL